MRATTAALLIAVTPASAQVPTRARVQGTEVATPGTPHPKGSFVLEAQVAGDAVEVPHCAGRGHVTLGTMVYAPPPGPFVIRMDGKSHLLKIEITVSDYEKRIACGDAIRVGKTIDARDGLVELTFPSPEALGGRAVVYVPPGHDATKPAAMLVGLHPWNGTMWTYAAYGELLKAARDNDVVLLFPSGLGNSLYVAAAEAEVMRAIAAAQHSVAVDPQRISLWGASMGGGGATTVGFHHPDRFAFIASLFGDSKYDLSTYVKSILGGDAGAHRVNALDIADNARHIPVWLIHGEADTVSPIAQSEMLQKALAAKGFKVDFDRVAGAGHEGSLVARFLARIVQRAATATAPVNPQRVSFWSVRREDTSAYGVTIDKSADDSFIDIELSGDAVHVRAHQGVSRVTLSRGALGTKGVVQIANDTKVPVEVRWAP